MSEEIKEILDKLKDSNWYDELDLTGTRWIELTWKETHLLLDYITNLQQKVEQLEKEVNEYQKELEKADSITQSCIFQGKQESKISFRNCLNRLEQLENIRKEAIKYIKKNLTIGSILDGKKTYCLNSYSFDYEDLLDIVNKGE